MAEATQIRDGKSWAFDAFVVGIRFNDAGVAGFVLGDGVVALARIGSPDVLNVAAHNGACLSFAVDGAGDFITGGDDGRLVRTTAVGVSSELAKTRGKWIEHVTVSPDTGLIAYAAGKDATILDPKAPMVFSHGSTVGGLAFDPKGRRLAVSHYNGVSLWWAKSANQQAKVLPWLGSHLDTTWSPDGRFLVTSMQEAALHGWRLEDAADMKMTGYPAKVKSLAWDRRGRFLFTSGAPRVIAWSFTGRSGPMGKEPMEMGPERDALVTAVAAHPRIDAVAAGMGDGTVWFQRFDEPGAAFLALHGAPISALTFSPDGSHVAIGAEDGFAAIVPV